MNVILIVGNMGTGKSSLAAEYLALKLRKEPDKEYRLVSLPEKDSSTMPIYEKALGEEVRRWKGFTFLMVKQYGHDKMLWFEDYPLLAREKKRAGAVEGTVTALARQNNLFCVLVSQVSLPMAVPWDIKVELKKDGQNRYLYKIKDRMAKTDWKESTGEEKKLAEELIDIEYNGIVGSVYEASKKDTGRPIDTESYQAKVYAMFASGKRPRQITKELGLKSQSYEYVKVYVYYSRWKAKGKAGLGVVV